MKCLICSEEIQKHRKYCSYSCAAIGRVGTKRPDTTLRNTTDNPVWNPVYKARMIEAKRGRKQPIEEIQNRIAAIKKRHEIDPTLRFRQTIKIREINESKPFGWKRSRAAAIKRDNYLCQNCGKDGKRLVVHHKDHRGKNLSSAKDMNNNLDNLITLCSGCHISIHTWAVRRERSKVKLP